MSASGLTWLRALLHPHESLARATEHHGYLDVTGGYVSQSPPSAQRLFVSARFASIYAGVFRPLVFVATGGATPAEDLTWVSAVLGLGDGQLLLDVCCGPGNFTRPLSRELGSGLAIGLDLSEAMLERAVRKAGDNAVFVRGDAQDLPFAAATFDAVCCLAALDLVPDPARVVAEMARVLAPGGCLAIATTYEGAGAVARRMSVMAGRVLGLRVYDAPKFVGMLGSLGLVDVRQGHSRFSPVFVGDKAVHPVSGVAPTGPAVMPMSEGRFRPRHSRLLFVLVAKQVRPEAR